MTNIVLVDDQRLVRHCLRARLESVPEFQVVAEADSGEEAKRIVAQYPCDIVLMDLHMPGIGGLEATRRLLAAEPELRIIGLSMYVGGPYPRKFMELGGAGYVSKNADTTELIEAIRLVEAGKAYISNDVAQQIAADDTLSNLDHAMEELTRREIQVLHQISEGLSITEIADRLCLSPKTVRASSPRVVHQTRGAKRCATCHRRAHPRLNRDCRSDGERLSVPHRSPMSPAVA